MFDINHSWIVGSVSIAVLASVLAFATAGHTQNPGTVPDEAAASYTAFNSAFLVQTDGKVYYGNSVNDHGEAFMWGQASDIYIAEDYYDRTRDPVTLTLITQLLNEFIAKNGATWNWDTWNDDLDWGIIALVRGYQVTGNSTYLTAAEDNWKTVYDRGWDDVDGGGIWENQDKFSKCALSNDPFAIAGCALYTATGIAEYLTKSEAAYGWVRQHIFSSSASTSSLGPPGQVDEALTNKGDLQFSDNVYNAGCFLEAGNCLRRATHDISYYNDELLVIKHIVGEGPVMSIGGQPGNPQYQYWFVKGLGDFCTDNNQWSTYFPWMLGNANACWASRDSLNLTEDDWKDVNTNANPAGLNASSAVAIWQFLKYPKQYRIINAFTGLAMGVTDGNEAENSEIDQWTLSSDPGQQWMVVPLSNGHCAIVSNLTGMAVAISGDQSDDTEHLIDRRFSINDASEQYDLLPQGGDDYLVKNVSSGLVLNDYHGLSTNGTKIVQLEADGHPNQKWKIVPGN
jgi:hypothetical protein